MNLSGKILKLFGWRVNLSVPDFDKCIICVAPHTSNWDFVLGELAYLSVGRKAGFLMKETWFFFPLGIFFRAIGGIPVPRGKKRGGSLVDFIVDKFNHASRLSIAITPEGTRSKTGKWHTGFLTIAFKADIPIILGAIDASTKSIFLDNVFIPTGNIDEDMKVVKDYYKGFVGLNPDNFTV